MRPRIARPTEELAPRIGIGTRRPLSELPPQGPDHGIGFLAQALDREQAIEPHPQRIRRRSQAIAEQHAGSKRQRRCWMVQRVDHPIECRRQDAVLGQQVHAGLVLDRVNPAHGLGSRTRGRRR